MYSPVECFVPMNRHEEKGTLITQELKVKIKTTEQ